MRKSLLKPLMKLLLKLLGVVAAMTLSTSVLAVGMGGINVLSALGQPLKANIELVAVSNADKPGLVAKLATPEAYKGSGLEYPANNKYTFQIETRANGEYFILASSAQPINDPFVSLLVEVTWAQGKLLREYTFLVDPPDFVAEKPKPAEVRPVAPTVPSVQLEVKASQPVEMPAVVESKSLPRQPEAMPVTKPPEAMPVQTQAKEKTVDLKKGRTEQVGKSTLVQAKTASREKVKVQHGDTLNKIAVQHKPDEISLERMLVALYRANINQFDAKNMNRIREGKILRLPVPVEIREVTQPEAVKEIRAQVADWNNYRQKMAGAAPHSSKFQDAQQVATGKIVSSVADKAPVVKESAREVLKLSKGEAPGDKSAGSSTTAQEKKNAQQEEAIAKHNSLQEEQKRAVLLEKNLKDMQRLAQLKSEAMALTQSPGLASAPWAASGVVPVTASMVTAGSSVAEASAVSATVLSTASVVAAASTVAAASAVSVVSAVAASNVVVAKTNPVPQPGLVDQLLGEPLYLAGGAAVLLGLGGTAFMARRRKNAIDAKVAQQFKSESVRTGRIAMPVAPSPDTGDFTTTTAAITEAAPPVSESVDPISEADLFLNFGRDAQAEEILKEALLNSPNDHRIHLKLLGIYANRKDTLAFAGIARQLRDSGDMPAWQEAEAMGRKLEPNNPMYGAEQTAVPPAGKVQDAQLAPLPDVDFDLGEELLKPAVEAEQVKAMDFDVSSNIPSSGLMDFDVSANYPTLNAPVKMDFDVSSATPAVPEAAEATLTGMDDLVFDITAAHPSLPEAAKPPVAEQNADMEFMLDFPVEEGAEKMPIVAPAIAEISLDMGDDAGAQSNEAKNEHWHEVATKLDLAKAYQEMGDATGAREILVEVLREGDEGQCKAAQVMLDQIGL